MNLRKYLKENVWGLIWSIITAVCMCLIFLAWGEKWWKSLVPFYGTYIIYKNTWKAEFMVNVTCHVTLVQDSCLYLGISDD